MKAYDRGRLNGALAVVACAAAAFVLVALVDLHTFLTRPNPLTNQASGMPAVQEPPWPAAQAMDAAKLPWVWDAAANFAPAQRAMADRPCGRLDLLRDRYPVWAEERWGKTDFGDLCSSADPHPNLVEDGIAAEGDHEGVTLELTEEGDVILERRGPVELAIDRRGLVVRSRR